MQHPPAQIGLTQFPSRKIHLAELLSILFVAEVWPTLRNQFWRFQYLVSPLAQNNILCWKCLNFSIFWAWTPHCHLTYNFDTPLNTGLTKKVWSYHYELLQNKKMTMILCDLEGEGIINSTPTPPSAEAASRKHAILGLTLFNSGCCWSVGRLIVWFLEDQKSLCKNFYFHCEHRSRLYFLWPKECFLF